MERTAKIKLLAFLAVALLMPVISNAGEYPMNSQAQYQTPQDGRSMDQNQNIENRNTVIMKDLAFNPPTIRVRQGETVTWRNQDSAEHTVTSENFDSGRIPSGGSFTQTFSSRGTFDYRCSIHPSMTGRVIVE